MPSSLFGSSGSFSFAVLWTYVWGILVVLLTFGFMIFVHELGHFLMAKRVGITVHEFALGFGPRLIRYKRKNDITEYCLRIVPFGGFVRMEGEDEPGNPEDPGNFNNQSVWNRAKVIAAGCVMNYITGTLILLMIGFTFGIVTSKIPARIVELKKGFPMEQAGLKVGDEIVSLDGTPIEDFEHLRELTGKKKDGEKVVLGIKRGNEPEFSVTVQVKYDPELQRPILGFSAPTNKFTGFKFRKATVGEVLEDTAKKVFNMTISPIIIIQRLAEKKITPKEVAEGSAGPVGIGQMLFEVSTWGIPAVLFMCAVLSILIGAFNLIPFPGLDGSRLFFLALEKIRKKPLDPEKEGFIHQMGFIALIILVLLVTWNDIMRIVAGKGILK